MEIDLKFLCDSADAVDSGMRALGSIASQKRTYRVQLRRTLVPSIADLLFLAIFAWLFAGASGWSQLLADGDTGWHIRNGQLILQNHSIPYRDWFGFGSEAHPWFAWEWLADVVFALLHRAAGLKAVVFFCGVLIAATQYVVFRHCLWRGINPVPALAVILAATNAASVHYLARPHVLTLFFTACAAWLLDADRSNRTRYIWLMPAVVALWVNLHGGFLAIFTLLGARLVECFCSKSRRADLPRLAVLIGVCGAATFLNPYGWRLHAHLWGYLHSSWIRDSIEEFQSPRFRSESMLWFELLLVLGIAALPRLISRMRIRDAALIVVWAHAALGSVRHVPLFLIVAAPPIAAELDSLFSGAAIRRGRNSVFAILRDVGNDWRPQGIQLSLLPVAVLIAFFIVPRSSSWPVDFPAERFPSSIVSRNERALSAMSAGPVRIFSTDQWSDYLIYRLHPKVQTYFDGRSDFFAEWRGENYRALMEGRPGCLAILDHEHARFALVPANWPLSELLRQNSQWHQVDRDSMALLFERR
jgi:hypothetical protein